MSRRDLRVVILVDDRMLVPCPECNFFFTGMRCLAGASTISCIGGDMDLLLLIPIFCMLLYFLVRFVNSPSDALWSSSESIHSGGEYGHQ